MLDKARYALIGSTPLDRASGASNGTGVDRLAHSEAESLTLIVQTGDDSGTPDSFSLAGKLQHSDDDGSTDTYDDITGAAITAITAEGAIAEVTIDPNQCKRYVRSVLTPTFVAGTSPKIFSSAVLEFTRAKVVPAS